MIEITIPEVVIPYVRMTQRSKYVDPRAIAYLSNQQTLKWWMRQAMEAGDYKKFGKVSLAVELIFYVKKKHVSDIDNLCKNMLDSAKGIIYVDDRWIDALNVVRTLSKEPSVTMRIRELC